MPLALPRSGEGGIRIFYNKIVNRFKNKAKLHIIPNFVDAELYKKTDEDSLPVEFQKKSNVFRIMYAGNIGYAQDWQPFLLLANHFKNNKNIEFVIIGEGILKNDLENEVRNKKFENVSIFPYQSRNLMPQINTSADLHFIFMNPKYDDQGFPSKVYSIMACSKPLLVISKKNASLNNFLKDKNCSIIIEEQDTKLKTEELILGLMSLIDNSNLLFEMGANGRKVIESNYSKEIVVKQYLNLVESI